MHFESVLYIMSPSAGLDMASLCADVIRVINVPFCVDEICNTEEGSGVVVPIPTWEKELSAHNSNRLSNVNFIFIFIVFISGNDQLSKVRNFRAGTKR